MYYVLVKWDDFIEPSINIDKAFDKRISPISNKAKVFSFCPKGVIIYYLKYKGKRIRLTDKDLRIILDLQY